MNYFQRRRKLAQEKRELRSKAQKVDRLMNYHAIATSLETSFLECKDEKIAVSVARGWYSFTQGGHSYHLRASEVVTLVRSMYAELHEVELGGQDES